jgi:hypothetical protein
VRRLEYVGTFDHPSFIAQPSRCRHCSYGIKRNVVIGSLRDNARNVAPGHSIEFGHVFDGYPICRQGSYALPYAAPNSKPSGDRRDIRAADPQAAANLGVSW